eukprot:4903661-Amphidinium_carterae.1
MDVLYVTYRCRYASKVALHTTLDSGQGLSCLCDRKAHLQLSIADISVRLEFALLIRFDDDIPIRTLGICAQHTYLARRGGGSPLSEHLRSTAADASRYGRVYHNGDDNAIF